MAPIQSLAIALTDDFPRIHPAHLQLDAGAIPLYLLNKEN